MKYLSAATLALTFVAIASAQPKINSGGILNVASYSIPGLPNSSIAQGSIFVIFGSGLGPAAVASSGFPLKTTFGGTSVTISAGGQTLSAPIIYTVATQVAAILPSKTPVGAATATVTYQGATSDAQSFQVAASSFGTFSLNQQGNGTGIITDANYKVFLATSAARSGDAAIIWGTGLGAVADDIDQAKVGNLSVPTKVYVGGKQATLSYNGRSPCCVGLDQIVFTVPTGVTGCSVPVVVLTNNIVSNTTTMPVGADASRTCSDPTGLTAAQTALLQSKGSLKLGYVSLDRSTSSGGFSSVTGGGPTTTDTGSGYFVEYTPTTFAGAGRGFQVASVGACIVYTYSFSSTTPTPTTALPVGLDAGTAINVVGPNGTKQLLPTTGSKGLYDAELSSGTPPAPVTLYLDPGAYTIDNGSGGADVGAFKVNLTVPQPLTWTNMSTISTTPINRSQGVTVNWTGGAPGTYVNIDGYSIMTNATGDGGVAAFFTCLAPQSALAFTVGPDVLLQLPASSVISAGGFSFSLSSMSVGNAALPTSFTATGLDYGFASTAVSASTSVVFQ